MVFRWKFRGTLPGVCSFVHVESVKDSIINGKNCHKLIATHKWHNDISSHYIYPSMFVYEENDTVFMWNPLNQKFLVTYIFNVNAGDSLILDYPSFLVSNQVYDTVYHIIIDSVSQQNLDGQLLNKYYFHSHILFGTHYMDRIGSFFWFYPRFLIFLGEGAGMRCYSDMQIDTSLVTYPCDSLWNPFSSIETFETAHDISLFPNPANSTITLLNKNFDGNPIQFKLFDFQGNRQKQIEIHQNSQDIDVSEFKPGLYIYEIESEGQFLRNKLIIE